MNRTNNDFLFKLRSTNASLRFGEKAMDRILTVLATKQCIPQTYFVPRSDPNLFILKFSNEAALDKFTSLADLDTLLRRENFARHVSTPSDTVERAKKTIFVWNLNSHYFNCYTRDDGFDVDETMEMKKNYLIDDIKTRVGTRGMDVADHHFLQRSNTSPPHALKLTFANIDQATTFNDKDTMLSLGIMRSASKKA